MFKKFITTDAYATDEIPFGSGLPLEFMELQIAMAAQKEGFENYRVLCQTIKEIENKIVADLVWVKLSNIELLERIIENQEILELIVAASNVRLESLYQNGQISDKLRQHDLKIFPLNAAYLNFVFTESKNLPESQNLIQLVTELAAQHPPIKFNSEEGFLKREMLRDVDLEEFLQSKENINENVFYIRSLLRADDKIILPLLKKLRKNTKAKFPVSPESQEFHDKQIVIDDPYLRKYTMPTMRCQSNEIESLVDFYKKEGFEEGVVLKPGNGGSFGGTGIAILNSNISDDEIGNVIIQEISEMFSDANKHYQTDFSVQNIIAQKRLNNLSFDGELRAGDVRFSVINGELVGAALRYCDNDDVKILSYEATKSVLPNNLSFARKNIEILRNASSEEKKSYYDTLLKMHEAVMDIVAWSKENRHFHNGVDMLLGRDKSGNWQFCLTEINNVTPDCIPETSWLNSYAGEGEDKIKICESIVRIIKNNQHITANGE